MSSFGLILMDMLTVPEWGMPLKTTIYSKLASSALPIDPNDFPASVCTSELCNNGYIRLQLYCIVLYTSKKVSQGARICTLRK